MDPQSGDPRLVVVLEQADEQGVVSVGLLSDVIEQISDQDVLVAPGLDDIPFPALVQTDIVGPVWTTQLSAPVGRLSEQVLGAFRGAFDTILTHRRGLPIQGRNDTRWDVKKKELAALWCLTNGCMQALMDGSENHAVPDPAFFAPMISGEAADDRAMVRLASLASDPDWSLTGHLAGDLHDAGVFELDRWRSVGFDCLNSFLPRFQAPIDSDRGGELQSATEVAFDPPRADESSMLLANVLRDCAARGRRHIHLKTVSEFWAPPTRREVNHVSVSLGRLGLSHVIVDDLEKAA